MTNGYYSPPPPVPCPINKQFNCWGCDKYQCFPENSGECRAHPPKHCCAPEETQTNNYWPIINGAETHWCAEFRRATFDPDERRAPEGNVRNDHNPEGDLAGVCCFSCDHFQLNLGRPDRVLGYCCAQAPKACCITPDTEYTNPNTLPKIEKADIKWCAHWKRATDGRSLELPPIGGN